MCAVWDVVAECFVRNSSPAPNLRVARESDFDPLPTLSSRDVFRGCTSWEHLQYPESVFPTRSEIFPESICASATQTPRWDALGNLTVCAAVPIAGNTVLLPFRSLLAWTASESAQKKNWQIGIGLSCLRVKQAQTS